MWSEQVDSLSGGATRRITLTGDSDALVTVGDFFDRLTRDDEFRKVFSTLLVSFGYRALRWETPPLSEGSLGKPFECVVIDSPRLDRPASQQAFREHFARSWEDDVAVFENLGGDATLVVPCPAAGDAAYCHLASFLERGPAEQVDALWRRLAEIVLGKLSSQPMWVNTAGGGVPWLHLRLDSRPKYYHHAAYKVA